MSQKTYGGVLRFICDILMMVLELQGVDDRFIMTIRFLIIVSRTVYMLWCYMEHEPT